MLSLAHDVVENLGRWPAALSSCGSPKERRLEVRLALLIFNSSVAEPLSTHPNIEFFNAIACKREMKALRARARLDLHVVVQNGRLQEHLERSIARHQDTSDFIKVLSTY